MKRLYFEEAGQRWGYVLRGWPLSEAGKTMQLPGGELFTQLSIAVEFDHFASAGGDAEGRVPAASIQRLDREPDATPPGAQQFPYQAVIQVDLDDLAELLDDPARFLDTIIHEIGHVLGIGMSWSGDYGPPLVRLIEDCSTVYTGAAACQEYAGIKGQPAGTTLEIPLDTEADGTTKAYHWSEKALQFEIMSTQLDMPTAGGQPGAGSNVISRVSVGALQDLGYLVNMAAAQPLPAG
jgi:hypothetical protein